MHFDFLGFYSLFSFSFFLLHVQTMSSVYFPAHVVVLFRRIVNVVSTISISNQYVLSTQSGLADDTVHPKMGSSNWSASFPSKQSFAYFRNLEWPWWTQRRDWGGISVVGEEICAPRDFRKAQRLSVRDDYGGVLKGTSFVIFTLNE